MKVFFLVAMENTHTGEWESLRQRVEVERVIIPPPRVSKRRAGILASLAIHELSAFPRILGIVLRETEDVALVCTTAHYAALMAMHVALLLRRRTRVYLSNFYLHALGRNRVVRLVLRLALTPSVGILVFSPNEVGYFNSLAPRTHVDYCPYGGQVIHSVDTEDIRLGEHVFTGGYANRDYETVVAAARSLPRTEFVIICTAANRLPDELPANVRILRDVEPPVFYSLLAGSRCVILPMKDDVGSSGQMVALAAMQFGKLTLYVDFPCVAQYFTDGVTGVAYKAGDPGELARKLVAFADDPSIAARIGAAAREAYLREFSAGYGDRLAENALRFLSPT